MSIDERLMRDGMQAASPEFTDEQVEKEIRRRIAKSSCSVLRKAAYRRWPLKEMPSRQHQGMRPFDSVAGNQKA